MELATQAGSTTTNMVVDLPGYGTVKFHPNVIADILALVNVKKNHKVEYNSSNGNEFIVTKNDGSKKHSSNQRKDYTTWKRMRVIRM